MTPREIAEQIFEYLEGKSCPESRSVAIYDVERIVARALGKSQRAECECCRRLQAHLDDAERQNEKLSDELEAARRRQPLEFAAP